MKVDYYIINKKVRKEFDGLIKQCEKLYRNNYYTILRYCKNHDGIVVNEKFGEQFGSKFIKMFDKSKKETEMIYKIKIGCATSNGFFMNDLTMLGVHSFSQLIGFLKSNKEYIIEDERGSKVGIAEMKRMVLIKGEHLYKGELMNQRRREKIEKALGVLREVLIEEEQARDSMEEYFSGTSRYEEADEACNNLEEAISLLEEI